MKIISVLLTLILSLHNILAESKTLGDWATFHREADNLFRNTKHEDAVSLYRQVIKGRLPFRATGTGM